MYLFLNLFFICSFLNSSVTLPGQKKKIIIPKWGEINVCLSAICSLSLIPFFMLLLRGHVGSFSLTCRKISSHVLSSNTHDSLHRSFKMLGLGMIFKFHFKILIPRTKPSGNPLMSFLLFFVLCFSFFVFIQRNWLPLYTSHFTSLSS